MQDNVINIYKKVGQTPLDCINTLKKEKEELRFIPMTYAGRLDPLAEGVLLILIGDECHKKDQYLSLPKEYEVDVLFGFATDTYDVMGKIIAQKATVKEVFKRSSDEGNGNQCQTILNTSFTSASECENWCGNFATKIQKILSEFIGRINQSYPPYSSRTVNGKPLFEWAREGKLDEIDIPSHDVSVENIEIIGEKSYLGAQLLSKVKEDIGKVKGDFRQKEIINIWEKELRSNYEEKYSVIKLRISCGSGVYVRGIAQSIGEKLGIPSLALKIVRTKVGNYGI